MRRTVEDFESRRVKDPDIVELRFKHFQQRLLDTINRVIVERKRLKIEMLRGNIRKSAPVGGQAKA